MNDLILIDFSWLYNKYYYVASYSASQNKEDKEAVLYKMLVQFLMLIKKSYPYAKIVMALDSPTSTLSNYTIFEGYKQNRNKEGKKEVYSYLNSILKKLIKVLDEKSFAFMKSMGYEADQLLAYLIKKYCNKYYITLFSGDKDLLQLTSYPNVHVSDKFEKGKFLIKSDEEIFQKFKNNKGEDFSRISTNKRDILKYRTLKGDTSDNLSPVFPRIKDKEIAEIIQNHWVDDQEEPLTEERINKIIEDDLQYENPALAEKLRENKEIWLRNYKIMDLLHIEDLQMRRIK